MQCSQQALASDFIEGQAVGAFSQVILYVLVALGQFLDQHGGAVEVGDHFVLVAVETLLDVIQLTLGAARRGIGQQASDDETNHHADDQGQGRQQPNKEREFHESFLYKRLCFTLTAQTCAVYRERSQIRTEFLT
ncbi:hypothetical protein D3C75_824910 [compost metagenome]